MRPSGEARCGTRWEASKRPLFVKTVWLDGRRHAILSRDDPHIVPPSRRASSAAPRRVPSSPGRKPRRSSVDTRRAMSSATADLEECLRRLRLAFCSESGEREADNPKRMVPPLSAPPQRCRGDDSSTTRQFSALIRRAPSPPPPQAAQLLIPAESFLPESNPLSERVLQWLDLEVRRQNKRREDGEVDGQGEGRNFSPLEKCRRTARQRRASWRAKRCDSGSEDLPRVVARPLPLSCTRPCTLTATAGTIRFPPTDSGVESGESSRGATPPPPKEEVQYSSRTEWEGESGRNVVRRELHIFVPVQVDKETPRIDDQMSDCGSVVCED